LIVGNITAGRVPQMKICFHDTKSSSSEENSFHGKGPQPGDEYQDFVKMEQNQLEEKNLQCLQIC
jgi:hypothetical protein